jgi:hypothetical protein
MFRSFVFRDLNLFGISDFVLRISGFKESGPALARKSGTAGVPYDRIVTLLLSNRQRLDNHQCLVLYRSLSATASAMDRIHHWHRNVL